MQWILKLFINDALDIVLMHRIMCLFLFFLAQIMVHGYGTKDNHFYKVEAHQIFFYVIREYKRRPSSESLSL